MNNPHHSIGHKEEFNPGQKVQQNEVQNTGGSNVIFYTICPGDTLHYICQIFNTSFKELSEANPSIEKGTIYVGQQLTFPLKAIGPKNTFTYRCQKKDTLRSISQKFKITPWRIQKDNPNVKFESFNENQRIKISKTGQCCNNSENNYMFFYPFNWRKINNERYVGSDGFVQVSVVPCNNLLEACLLEAIHCMKPYGMRPAISPGIAAGRDCFFLFPSPDQDEKMNFQAALFIRHPNQRGLLGEETAFMLFSDKYHIREIADTLIFPYK